MTIGQLNRDHRTTEPLVADNSTVSQGQLIRQPWTTEPSATVELAAKQVIEQVSSAGSCSAGLAACPALVAPASRARLESASSFEEEDKTPAGVEAEPEEQNQEQIEDNDAAVYRAKYGFRRRGTVTQVADPLPVKRNKYVSVATHDADRKPLPNRLCYPELYAEWKKYGGKLYKCKRCKEIIQWEEHHHCPGYIPDPLRLNTNLTAKERGNMRRGQLLEAGDWDDDQHDMTTPEPGGFDKLRHEALTGETYDQVVIDGMTEEEFLRRKFGHDISEMFEPDDNYEPWMDGEYAEND